MSADRKSLRFFLRRTWWIWIALLTAYALLAASLPAMDDEVYYWTWSKSLQFSYYDHPGMTAWLIWLSTQLFGDTILGMRFPACVCTTVTLAILSYLTSARDVFSCPLAPAAGERVRERGTMDHGDDDSNSPPLLSSNPEESATVLTAVEHSPPLPNPLPRNGGEGTKTLHPILFGVALTPLFTFGGILITPDAPLIACWALYLLWLVLVQQQLVDSPSTHWRWWLIGGVLLGLGGLSKYTMILAVPAGFASFLLSGLPWRRWVGGYVVHGAVAVAVASPILLYNVQRNFEPLLFQWRHAMHDEPATVTTFFEFFGVQLALFGTLPFYLVPWVIRHHHRLTPSPRLRVCSCLYMAPLLFFLYKAARTELEGNWGLVAFLSVWPVAAAWYDTVHSSRLWRWLAAASFLPPAICVLALTIHLLSPLPLIPVEQDRLSKQRGRWEMSQQLANAIHDRGEAIPTFSHTYQMIALLRFRGVDARQEGDYRPSHYTFPPQHLADFPAGYLVTDAIADPLPIEGMTAELIGTFPTIARETRVHEHQLWRYRRK